MGTNEAEVSKGARDNDSGYGCVLRRVLCLDAYRSRTWSAMLPVEFYGRVRGVGVPLGDVSMLGKFTVLASQKRLVLRRGFGRANRT